MHSCELGLWSVVCGRWPVVSGRWSVPCWMLSCELGLWSVVCGLWSVAWGIVIWPFQSWNRLRMRPSRCAWFSYTLEQGEWCLYRTASSHALCPILLFLPGTKYGTKIRSFLHLSRVFTGLQSGFQLFFFGILRRGWNILVGYSIFGPAPFNFGFHYYVQFIFELLRSPLVMKDYSWCGRR